MTPMQLLAMPRSWEPEVIFPQDGSIFIPSHLRVLHVTQEAFILNTSPWQNLIFGADASQVEPSRVRQILERMQMRVTLNLIEEELHEAARGTLDRKDWRKQEDGASLWLESLTYTEKVKLHLARALLMNPEVMVLHRPLHHYDADTAKMVLGLLKASWLKRVQDYQVVLAIFAELELEIIDRFYLCLHVPFEMICLRDSPETEGPCDRSWAGDERGGKTASQTANLLLHSGGEITGPSFVQERQIHNLSECTT